MPRTPISGTDLVAMEERRLREQLCHERDMNRAYERRCPGARVTPEYQRGPCSPSSFYTEAGRLRHLIRLEFAKFNPTIRVDPCGTRRPCHEPRPTEGPRPARHQTTGHAPPNYWPRSIETRPRTQR